MSTLLIILLTVVGTVIALIIIVAIFISRDTSGLNGNEMFEAHFDLNRPRSLYITKEEERKIPEEIKNYALYNGVSHMIDSPEARLTYQASLAALFDRNPNKWREDFYMGQKKISEMKKEESFDQSVRSEIEIDILNLFKMTQDEKNKQEAEIKKQKVKMEKEIITIKPEGWVDTIVIEGGVSSRCGKERHGLYININNKPGGVLRREDMLKLIECFKKHLKKYPLNKFPN